MDLLIDRLPKGNSMPSIDYIKRLAYILIALAAVLVAGFIYVGIQDSHGKQTLFFDRIELNGGNQPAIVSNYVGTINDDIRIHMHLQIKGERVMGYYYYDIFEKILILKGIIDRNGDVRIVEYDENEVQTGVFQGRFKEDFSGIAGTWSSEKGKKNLPFSLDILKDSEKMIEYLYE